jgi:hypothetical protein
MHPKCEQHGCRADDVLRFVETWRTRLLARHPYHPALLSDEEFGQLVTLNTVIAYITER